MLDALGLDTVTESVYRRMLAHPEDGVQALSAGLGLPEREIREALDQLSALALVRSSSEPPYRAYAVSPHLGMEILLTRQEAELVAHRQRVEEGRAAAARLISEFAHQPSGVPEADVQYLDGLDSVRDYLMTLNDSVEEEFLTFAPGGAQTAANMAASRPLNRRLLDRGIQMRTLYLDSVRHDSASVEHAEWITEHGGQVRTVPVLPTRMILCDRRVAIIAADSENTAAGAVVLKASGMVDALCALFECVWQAAEPLGEPQRRVDGLGLTRQQSEALRLLAEGHTDQAVAKRLGVSPRTARRIATELMTLLNARSRFQAGVHAVRRGHLPAAP